MAFPEIVMGMVPTAPRAPETILMLKPALLNRSATAWMYVMAAAGCKQKVKRRWFLLHLLQAKGRHLPLGSLPLPAFGFLWESWSDSRGYWRVLSLLEIATDLALVPYPSRMRLGNCTQVRSPRLRTGTDFRTWLLNLGPQNRH